MSVIEFRVALTTEEYDRLVSFYQNGLGLEPGPTWQSQGHGQILHSGNGVLEILDKEHAAHVDAIEVGHQVSSRIRFAFHVPNIYQSLENAKRHGATVTSEPTLTPWNDLNARIVSPDGMQITLFQATQTESESKP